ncbi:hypothetical protein [Nocardioides gilvus]|uniref:hypothetical protein n=1 Tax=Nocardioides gilvus TaxID=1735589 RepID=UPI000D746A55|nr:hypothetical protein [Nocardioides gilvus]
MASVRAFRVTTAYVVWGLSVLLALGMAGAALLVALKADSAEPLWRWWLEGADAVTFGWFARPEGAWAGEPTERDTVLRWGSAALAALGTGAVAQWILRPPRR